MNGIISAAQGRLPRDAGELKYTAQGRALLSFSIAVDDARRGDHEPTEWLRVTLWGELAEQLDGALTKGREVYVEGRIRLKSWTTAEGIERPSLDLSAWTCQLIGAIGRQAPRRPRQDSQAGQPSARMPEAVAAAGAGRNLRQALGLDDDDAGPC